MLLGKTIRHACTCLCIWRTSIRASIGSILPLIPYARAVAVGQGAYCVCLYMQACELRWHDNSGQHRTIRGLCFGRAKRKHTKGPVLLCIPSVGIRDICTCERPTHL